MSMATPLRKDRPEEELTTADLAQGRPNRADEHPETRVPKPAVSARGPVQGKVQEIREEHGSASLFPNNELENLRNRWNEIQTAFVDEPRKAVEQADGLVASAMKRLAEVFAENGRNSKSSGTAETQFPLRTCASRCSAIGRFSTGCYRFSVARNFVGHFRRGGPRLSVHLCRRFRDSLRWLHGQLHPKKAFCQADFLQPSDYRVSSRIYSPYPIVVQRLQNL